MHALHVDNIGNPVIQVFKTELTGATNIEGQRT